MKVFVVKMEQSLLSDKWIPTFVGMTVLLMCLSVFSLPVAAEDAEVVNKNFRSTGLPIPRFVSLRSDKAYMRTGPGKTYPVKWVYKKENLPVEVISEFETWRQIKDVSGEIGWVHQSLTQGRRFALVQDKEAVPMYEKTAKKGRIIANLEPMSHVAVKSCDADSCHVFTGGFKGWIEKKSLWGIYEQEKFD